MSKKTIYEDKILRREIEMKAANDFEEKLSADEVSMCILTMERKRVSFFADHVWPNRRMGKLVWSLTADGRRSIAHQNGLAGMKPPEFVESADPQWKGKRPAICRVTVFRKMFYDGGKSVHLCAYHGEARWDEFVGLKRNGDVNAQWRQRPYNQLAKCAEMQALRRGFPEGELGDDGGEMIEEDDLPLNEVATPQAASVTPAPERPVEQPEPPERAPEPPETQPAPEPEKAPPTIDQLREEATPMLKAYCDKLNGGVGLSWKAAYTQLAGVVGDKMDVTDYQTLISCLREQLEGASA